MAIAVLLFALVFICCFIFKAILFNKNKTNPSTYGKFKQGLNKFIIIFSSLPYKKGFCKIFLYLEKIYPSLIQRFLPT